MKMSTLENHRHELFSQNIAQGMTQTQAYVEAGYAELGAEQNASRLMLNDKVSDRVAELQKRGSQKVEVTIAYLLESGISIMEGAQAEKNYGAASATLERLAKISGHWVDKSKTEQVSSLRQFLDCLE